MTLGRAKKTTEDLRRCTPQVMAGATLEPTFLHPENWPVTAEQQVEHKDGTH